MEVGNVSQRWQTLSIKVIKCEYANKSHRTNATTDKGIPHYLK